MRHRFKIYLDHKYGIHTASKERLERTLSKTLSIKKDDWVDAMIGHGDDFFRIAIVNLVLPRKKLINLLIKRAEYIRTQDESKLAKIDIKIEKEKDKNLDKMMRPVSVYITFENKKAAMVVQSLGKDEKAGNLFDHKLRIKKVYEPTDIIWENQEVSYSDRFKQVVKITIYVTVVLLTVSHFIYQAKMSSQNRLYLYPSAPQECHPIYHEFKNDRGIFEQLAARDLDKFSEEWSRKKWQLYLYDAAVLKKLQGYFACYCMQVHTRITPTSSLEAKLEKMCTEFHKLEAVTQNLNIYISFFIFVSNMIIRHLVITLCTKIGFKTQTWMVFYERKIILAMQFINSIMIMLLMGAKLDFMGAVGERFNGDYRDFTSGWYRVIGTVYITTMMFYMAYPFMEITIDYVLRKWTYWSDQGKLFNQERFPEETKCRTVWQYFETYVGSEFLFEYKYPAMGMIVMTCFIFGPGIPILFPIGFVSVLTHYMFTKY